MKTYKIPEKNLDLRRYAFLKNLKRVVSCLAYCAIFALSYMFYIHNGRNEALPTVYLAIFIFAVLFSSFFIFKMNRFLFERSFDGKIESISFSRNYDRGMTRNAKRSLDFHTYIKLTVKDRRGSKRKIKVQLFEDGFDGYYREGENLVFFRGLNFPISLEAESRAEHICTVCGVRRYGKEKDSESCLSCGHSLIDVSDLKN